MFMKELHCDLKTLEAYIGKNFLVADPGAVRLLCATVIANRLPGDPVWLFLVAPPSGLKTELLNALGEVNSIFHLSSLTPKTLISGQVRAGPETSLLFHLNDKVVIFKDFTTILEMNQNARDEIISQLREVYDGKFSKSFGTGQHVDWEGKVGFIAGVTDAIELHQGKISVMGERFVQYRIIQPDREAAVKKGLENAEKILEIRSEMKKMFFELLENVEIPDTTNQPKVPKELKDEIIELSTFATVARAGIVRDSKDREISHVFPPEMPVRFAKQLIQLSKAFILLDSFGKTERDILRRITLSSISRSRRRVLLMMLKRRSDMDLTGKEADVEKEDEIDFEEEETGLLNENTWITSDLGLTLDLPVTTTRRICEELNALRLIKRFKKVRGNADGWELLPKYRTLLAKHFSEYVID